MYRLTLPLCSKYLDHLVGPKLSSTVMIEKTLYFLWNRDPLPSSLRLSKTEQTLLPCGLDKERKTEKLRGPGLLGIDFHELQTFVDLLAKFVPAANLMIMWYCNHWFCFL